MEYSKHDVQPQKERLDQRQAGESAQERSLVRLLVFDMRERVQIHFGGESERQIVREFVRFYHVSSQNYRRPSGLVSESHRSLRLKFGVQVGDGRQSDRKTGLAHVSA